MSSFREKLFQALYAEDDKRKATVTVQVLGLLIGFSIILAIVATEPVVRSVKSENVCSILNIGSCSRLIRACRLSGVVVVAALVAPLADRIGGMRNGGGIACVQPELEPGKLRGRIEGNGLAVEDGQA